MNEKKASILIILNEFYFEINIFNFKIKLQKFKLYKKNIFLIFRIFYDITSTYVFKNYTTKQIKFINHF